MTVIELAQTLTSLLDYADPEVSVQLAYSDDTRESKTVIVRVPSINYPTPGLGDAFATVEISGMTFTSEDPDRALLNGLLADTVRIVHGWTREQITEAINRAGVTCDGMYNYAQAMTDTADTFVFTLTFTIAIQNFNN